MELKINIDLKNIVSGSGEPKFTTWPNLYKCLSRSTEFPDRDWQGLILSRIPPKEVARARLFDIADMSLIRASLIDKIESPLHNFMSTIIRIFFSIPCMATRIV